MWLPVIDLPLIYLAKVVLRTSWNPHNNDNKRKKERPTNPQLVSRRMEEDTGIETQLNVDDKSVRLDDTDELHGLILDSSDSDTDGQNKKRSIFHISRPNTPNVERYPSNTLDEVNPFALLRKDDEDDASIGSEGDFGAKLLPQADGRGDFENVYEVRRNMACNPVR